MSKTIEQVEHLIKMEYRATISRNGFLIAVTEWDSNRIAVCELVDAINDNTALRAKGYRAVIHTRGEQ